MFEILGTCWSWIYGISWVKNPNRAKKLNKTLVSGKIWLKMRNSSGRNWGKPKNGSEIAKICQGMEKLADFGIFLQQFATITTIKKKHLGSLVKRSKNSGTHFAFHFWFVVKSEMEKIAEKLQQNCGKLRGKLWISISSLIRWSHNKRINIPTCSSGKWCQTVAYLSCFMFWKCQNVPNAIKNSVTWMRMFSTAWVEPNFT